METDQVTTPTPVRTSLERGTVAKQRFIWLAYLQRGRVKRFFLRKITRGDRNATADLIEKTYQHLAHSDLSYSGNAKDVTLHVRQVALEVGLEWRARDRSGANVTGRMESDQRGVSAADSGPGVCTTLSALDVAGKLQPVLNALPIRARDAFRLRQKGLSHKAIAIRLRVSTATVKRDLASVGRACTRALDDGSGDL